MKQQVRILLEEAATTAAADSSSYVCSNNNNDVADAMECAETCIGIANCDKCDCRLTPEDANGPWGSSFMDVLLCILPILFLIYATLNKTNPLPTTRSLPLAALMLWWIRLAYLESDVIQTCAAVVLGLHEALTPVSIMAGAIALFETMEATYCLPYMMREMKALTNGHPIAECMLIFCFAMMVEGASGFGTPVALGAPMLVSTGHPVVESIVVLLLMNTFATVWGAVGTPIWFGFGNVGGLDNDELLTISQKAAVGLGISAFLLLPIVLTILVPKQMVRENLIFIFASLLTCIGPLVGIASVNYEFPSLIGGIVGCAGTGVLIQFKIGLHEVLPHHEESLGRDVQEIVSLADNSKQQQKQQQQQQQISSLEAINQSKKNNLENKDDAAAAAATSQDGIEGTTLEVKRGFHKMASHVSEVSLPTFMQPDPLEEEPYEVEDDDMNNFYFNEKEMEIVATENTSTTLLCDDEVPKQNDETKEEINSNLKTNTKENSIRTTSVRFNLESANCVDKTEENNVTATSRSGSEPSKVSKSHSQAVEKHLGPRKSMAEGYLRELILRTFPIWAVVLLLMLSRIESIGIKDYLTRTEPSFGIDFGTYGEFRFSASLVLQLKDILTYPNMNWKYELLYVPFFMPFVFVSLCTMVLFRRDMDMVKPMDVAKIVTNRLYNPLIALLGALSLVQLMIRSGTAAPAYLLGTILADWFGGGFVVVSPLLGALGSFFSGSTTVSNLTFGDIQLIAAESIGVSSTTMLALQVIGASAGNGVCLNNIIAACTVVGLTDVGEGAILKRTFKVVLAYTTIATVVMLAFFFRFN